jgi:hypothetical protein
LKISTDDDSGKGSAANELRVQLKNWQEQKRKYLHLKNELELNPSNAKEERLIRIYLI